MAERIFHRPDKEIMEQAIERYRDEPTGIILTLAWYEGLQRREIAALRWADVDYEHHLLRLPDREVPLEQPAEEILSAWQVRCQRFSEYVASSDRLRKRLVEQSISTLARHGLNAFGQKQVRLQDLRYDYIRRQFETHSWPYVLRVAGISLSTYRLELAKMFRGSMPEVPPEEPSDGVGEDFKLWRVLQSERGSPAGIALWLSSQLGLYGDEIVDLCWENVDFEAGAIRLPDRTVPLTVGAGNVLREEKARRLPGEDSHVILTPRTRRPMDSGRLATVTRCALIRGGIENSTMQNFRRDLDWENARTELRRYVAAKGSVSHKEAAELLGLTNGQTYARLARMCAEDELRRVGNRWYLASDAASPDQRHAAVLRHVAKHGPLGRREVAALLHLSDRSAMRLLHEMMDAGELARVPSTWKYGFPQQSGEKAE